MTYCLAIQLDEGLVFCSDSRTNAGADRVSTYSKMHRFAVQGDRSLILLTAGNLATSQAVVSQIQRDLEENAQFNISDAKYVSDIANYVGQLNVTEQQKHGRPGGPDAEGFNASASFILGGQFKGQPSELYLIYPEGNHITPSEQHPYLQIGETKYGKPILDRIIQPDTSPEIAIATVGPPLECLFYRNNSLDGFQHYIKLEEDHPYLTRIRQTWDESIRSAFKQLPSLTEVFEAD